MRKLNNILIAGLLGLAAILGTVAATRTTSLGAAARQSSTVSFQARTRLLDAYAASLQRSVAQKPPALPAVPKVSRASASAPVRVIYHRPPPVVVVKHTDHGDDGFEHGDGGGGDD